MSITLRFSDRDWERIRHDWTAWWAGELERPLVLIETADPSEGGQAPHAEGFASNYPLDMPIDDVLDRYQAALGARRYHGDAFPKWWPNFGPGIMAGFVGARVHCAPNTVWFGPAAEMPISAVHATYDAVNPWWQRVRGLTTRAVDRWRGAVCVAYTDLGGNLDIVASLRSTQQLLFDLQDAPEEVARLVDQVTRLWLRYYDELDALIRPGGRGSTPWAAIWSPGRCYMLQSDFSYMISPRLFERYVLPDLAACCEAMDHGFYHLDGKGQLAHLDTLLSLPRLRGIQWVPGDGNPPPDQWLPLLKRIRDAGKLCQVYVSARGARTIVDELGGRGFALCVNEAMRSDEAEALLRVLVPGRQ